MRGFGAVLGLIAALVLVPGTSSADQSIDQIMGSVSAENVGEFAEVVGDHLDKIIGLKVSVDAGDRVRTT
ncbi:MAG: hypothetical protein M3453_07330 [Pseudomonadota bacterium]|nr:hypothetical protein [Pseudomonadota bacterium]